MISVGIDVSKREKYSMYFETIWRELLVSLSILPIPIRI